MKMCDLAHILRDVTETAPALRVFLQDEYQSGFLLSGSVILFFLFPCVQLGVFPAAPFWLAPKPYYKSYIKGKERGLILSLEMWVHLGWHLQTPFKESPGDCAGAEGNR